MILGNDCYSIMFAVVYHHYKKLEITLNWLELGTNLLSSKLIKEKTEKSYAVQIFVFHLFHIVTVAQAYSRLLLWVLKY